MAKRIEKEMSVADECTREYLLQLMRDIPDELVEKVEEIRSIVERLAEQTARLERWVQGLGDTAQKAVTIESLMDMSKGDEDEVMP